MSKVPFVDLNRQHAVVAEDLQVAFDRVKAANSYILGEETEKFEAEWSEFTGIKHTVGCSNGTDAIELALLALDIGPGDEVITVSNTFFATVESIRSVGAKPVLIDALAEDGLMDPSKIEEKVTANTKAIIPVHLYGQLVDMDPVLAVAKKNSLYVIEDAAQAHGATYNGKMAGGLGTCATFSFYPGKNLGALGDAGAVVTNDEGLAQRMCELRNHGRSDKYAHKDFGWNMRMDGLQAAFLSVKLKHLAKWNADRQRIAQIYHENLSDISQLFMSRVRDNFESHVFHLFVVLNDDREGLQNSLREQGIGAGVHYPLGCHQQICWNRHYEPVSLPVTEIWTAKCLSLPIFGEMRDEEAMAVCEALKQIFSS